MHPLNANLLLAIPLLPLIAALVAGLGGRVIGRAGAHTITCLAVGVSCLLSLFVLRQVYFAGAPLYDHAVYTWLVGDGMPMEVGFLIDRLTALMMIAFAGGAVVLVFAMLVLGPHLVKWIGDSAGHRSLVSWLWWTAEWPILLVGLLVAFAGILYLGPNVEHRRWSFLSVGALLAIVLFLLLSGAFAFYASRFGSYNKTWGSLSAVVVMLTWLWLSSVALLFGAEVNSETESSRSS